MTEACWGLPFPEEFRQVSQQSRGGVRFQWKRTLIQTAANSSGTEGKTLEKPNNTTDARNESRWRISKSPPHIVSRVEAQRGRVGKITAHGHTSLPARAPPALSRHRCPKCQKLLQSANLIAHFTVVMAPPSSNPIKCAEIDVNFKLQFHHNLTFWIPNTLNIRLEKRDFKDQCVIMTR